MMLMADDNANFCFDFGSDDEGLIVGDGDEDDGLTIDLATLFSILEEKDNNNSQGSAGDQSANDGPQGRLAIDVSNNETSVLGEGFQKSEGERQLVAEFSRSASSLPPNDLESLRFSTIFQHAGGNLDFSPQICSPVNSCSESLKDWIPLVPQRELDRDGVPQNARFYGGSDNIQLQYQTPTSSSGFRFDADSGPVVENNSDIDLGSCIVSENRTNNLGVLDSKSRMSLDRSPEDGTLVEPDVQKFSDEIYESSDWFPAMEYNVITDDTSLVDSSSQYSRDSSDLQHMPSNGEMMIDIKDEKEFLLDNLYSDSTILKSQVGRTGGYISGVSTINSSSLKGSTYNHSNFMIPFSGDSFPKPSDRISDNYSSAHPWSPAQSNMLSLKQEVYTTDDRNNEAVGNKSLANVLDNVATFFSGVDDRLSTDTDTKQLFPEDLSSMCSRKDVVYNVNETEDRFLGPSRAYHSQDFNDGTTKRNIINDRRFSVHDSETLSASVQQSYLSTHQLHCSKYERDYKPIQSQCMGSHLLKVGSESIQSNSSDLKSHVDDDSDLCILEDISKPARQNPLLVTRKSIVTSHRSAYSDPLLHSGVGVTRHKPNDERLVYRVALQDLSQPKSEALPPEGVLAVPLLRHQRIALSWMVQKETASLHCSGGILADDQGLGKTVSTIALILKERPPTSRDRQKNVQRDELETLNLDDDEDGVVELDGAREHCMEPKGRPAAGTLVVCPTSVLRQWADELHNKVTHKADLSVLVYHGSSRTKDPNELAKYDVVLTTYSIVSMEVPKQPLVDKDDEKGTSEANLVPLNGLSSSRKRKCPNSDKKGKGKKGVDSTLLESAARPLARVGWFRVVLDEAQSIKNHRTQVARACWGLRAKRRWCLSGTPIQNAIDDLYSYFRFLRYDPYSAYKLFCSMIKIPINRSPTTGYRKLQAVLKTIMLRRTKGTLLDGEPIINLPPKTIELKKVEFSDEERDFYLKLEADSRAQFQVYAAAGTVKQNYVNILLMLLRLRQACDHPALVKGCDSTSMWRISVETAKKLSREKQICLLKSLEASLALCGICNDPPEDAVVSICGHVFCNQCICEHLTGDDNKCPDTSCKIQLNAALVFSKATLSSSLGDQPVQHNSPDSSGSELAEANGQSSDGCSFHSSKIKAALEVLQSLSNSQTSASEKCSTNSFDETTSCQDISSSDHSGEVHMDISDERSSVSDKDLNDSVKVMGEKAIVFSQWTRMLDLFEVCLKSSSIQYRRLDGTMSVIARDKAVKDFNTLPEVTVMIMSLKAASLGLNMVAACHVLMLDLWWNPTTEDQAIDRAHRIGQTRPVKVLRLTVKDTVEDRILALQQKKREMVASAFGEDETGSRQTRLTVEDLQYLFEG